MPQGETTRSLKCLSLSPEAKAMSSMPSTKRLALESRRTICRNGTTDSSDQRVAESEGFFGICGTPPQLPAHPLGQQEQRCSRGHQRHQPQGQLDGAQGTAQGRRNQIAGYHQQRKSRQQYQAGPGWPALQQPLQAALPRGASGRAIGGVVAIQAGGGIARRCRSTTTQVALLPCVPSEPITWALSNAEPGLKADDRIRTGDVQLGKLTFYH